MIIFTRMSKAFTRESDNQPERPVVQRRASPLPPGTNNYLTPSVRVCNSYQPLIVM